MLLPSIVTIDIREKFDFWSKSLTVIVATIGHCTDHTKVRYETRYHELRADTYSFESRGP